MARTLSYVIPPAFDGHKVYQYLRGEARCSLRLINSVKRVPMGITLNGVHTRTIDLVRTGDVLELHIPDDKRPAVAADLPLTVVYEDEDVLVADKPPFMSVHPSKNHREDTLGNAVASYLQQKGRYHAFRPVGRLDMDTSGLVLCALNSYTASRLQGGMEKEYTAIACGEFHGKGTIDAPIRHQPERPGRREVGVGGDAAVTHWEALKTDGEKTVLRVTIETGRTHQIRVHFAYLGAPLLGDPVYGTPQETLRRQALHCGRLTFLHPVNGRRIELQSPLPRDMENVIKSL